MGLQPVIPYSNNLFKAYPFKGLDYLNVEVVMQLSQIFHCKILFQKLYQIRDVCIIISYDNQVININDYDYNPTICFFHIQ